MASHSLNRRTFLVEAAAVAAGAGMIGSDTALAGTISQADLTLAHFKRLRKNVFTLVDERGQKMSAKLVDVTALRSNSQSPGGRRHPFSLLFVVRGRAQITDGLYCVEHRDFGVASIYLVPVERDGRALEAVFG